MSRVVAKRHEGKTPLTNYTGDVGWWLSQHFSPVSIEISPSPASVYGPALSLVGPSLVRGSPPPHSLSDVLSQNKESIGNLSPLEQSYLEGTW